MLSVLCRLREAWRRLQQDDTNSGGGGSGGGGGGMDNYEKGSGRRSESGGGEDDSPYGGWQGGRAGRGFGNVETPIIDSVTGKRQDRWNYPLSTGGSMAIRRSGSSSSNRLSRVSTVGSHGSDGSGGGGSSGGTSGGSGGGGGGGGNRFLPPPSVMKMRSPNVVDVTWDQNIVTLILLELMKMIRKAYFDVHSCCCLN